MSDPQESLPLSPAVFHIMVVLAGGERHGYAIMQEVALRTNNTLHLGPGTLYGALKRMLAAGWIIETEARPDPELDDERRRYYRLTDEGQRVARAEAQRLDQLVSAARQQGLLGGRGA